MKFERKKAIKDTVINFNLSGYCFYIQNLSKGSIYVSFNKDDTKDKRIRIPAGYGTEIYSGDVKNIYGEKADIVSILCTASSENDEDTIQVEALIY